MLFAARAEIDADDIILLYRQPGFTNVNEGLGLVKQGYPWRPIWGCRRTLFYGHARFCCRTRNARKRRSEPHAVRTRLRSPLPCL